jgi:DNA replication protein DnaC
MEPIKNVLANLKRETNTPRQKNGDNSDRETPERSTGNKREDLRRSLSVSSLEHTFGNFEVLPGTAEAYKAFKALAEGESSRPLLLCYGGVGNGKTHLCEATVIALYERGTFCRYLTMNRVMRTFKAAMRPDAVSSLDVLLERFSQAQNLVMDDVGMGGSGSEWEYGQLEEIVNERYRERLFTIITTNRDLEELPERIVSRFYDPEVGAVVLNRGVDYRRRKS